MTAREHRLRKEIDRLRDQRERLMTELVGRGSRGVYRNCAYCGAWCYGRACQKHKDLLNLDPHFSGRLA